MHVSATWSWHALWARLFPLVFDGKWASYGSILWRPVHTWRSGRCKAFCFLQTSDILAWLLQNCNCSITQCGFAPFEIKCNCRFGATRNMSQLMGRNIQNQRYFVQRNNTTVFIKEQFMSSFEFKTVKITSINNR